MEEAKKQLLSISANSMDKHKLQIIVMPEGYNFERGLVIEPDKILEKFDNTLYGTPYYHTQEYKSYKEKLKEINYQTRRNYFLKFNSLTNEEFTEMKKKEIEIYERLKQDYLKTFNNFEHLVNNYSAANHDKLHNESIEELEKNMNNNIRYHEDKCYYIDTENRKILFDDIHPKLERILNNCRNSKCTKEALQAHVDYITKIQNSLNEMSLEEYKNYKINKMKLSIEELNKIKEETIATNQLNETETISTNKTR